MQAMQFEFRLPVKQTTHYTLHLGSPPLPLYYLEYQHISIALELVAINKITQTGKS